MYTVMTLVFISKKWGTKIVDGKERDDFYCFNEKCRKFIQEFDSIYSSYRKPDRKEPERFEYVIPDHKENFPEIFGLLSPFARKMDISIVIRSAYEAEDYENAAAFVLAFPKSCYYYDDEEDERYLSYGFCCDDCYAQLPEAKTYIRPTAGITKAFDGKCAGRTTRLNENIISPALRDYLNEHGIAAENFSPVYTKSERQLGYKISERIACLPAEAICNPSFGSAYYCPACGRVHYSSISEKPVLKKRFKGLRGGDYPNRDIFFISDEGIERLADISLTGAFFDDNRLTVISRRCFELIEKVAPEVKKTTIPVFKMGRFENKA